jgi:hypothetical protein
VEYVGNGDTDVQQKRKIMNLTRKEIRAADMDLGHPWVLL